ncbi:MAG: photosynthetic complex putative assembly protein PuhB [Pseudomonadota bacterium]
MAMLEHDSEPTPGMPQELPEGERVLWQGPPQFRRLLLSTFHVRKLGIYFALIIAATVLVGLNGQESAQATIASAFTFLVLAAVALGLLSAYAWFAARATMYTVTNRRVVLRTGVAVPVTVNIPFTRIEGASLRLHADGTGEVALLPDRSGRASYILLWPFVKPFRILRVQPVLRGIDAAADVAKLLAEQLTTVEPVELVVPEAPVREPSSAPEEPLWRRLTTYPTAPLAAACSLVVLALVAVTWGQLFGTEPEVRPQGPAAVAAVSLYFEDRDDGAVIVTDASSGVVLDTLEPGSNGFLRGAMRTFVSARRASDIGAETPFVLEQMPNGQLILRDPATERLIDLRAFGPTNAEAFGRFLELAAEPMVNTPDTPSDAGTLNATAVALSNQEVNP